MPVKDNQVYLEPVEAYGRIAPEYGQISQARRSYLDGIEQLVISQIPSGSRSLLDVGAGDGTRALRIARACRIQQLTLLKPSANMRDQWPTGTTGWEIRAEELHSKSWSFDTITCLWNVLGHIFPQDARTEVLRQCARLLSPAGLLFVDLNHRYNVSHYGWMPTIFRMMRDRLFPNETNGDVVASWTVDGTRYATKGHVFTHPEFRLLSDNAGLLIQKSYSVDYATGRTRKSNLTGNLLYVLCRR